MAKKTTNATASKEAKAAIPSKAGQVATEQAAANQEKAPGEGAEEQASTGEPTKPGLTESANAQAPTDKGEETAEDKAYQSAYHEYHAAFGSYPPSDVTTQQILEQLAKKQGEEYTQNEQQTKQSVFVLEGEKLGKALEEAGIDRNKPTLEMRNFILNLKDKLSDKGENYELKKEFYDYAVNMVDREAKGAKDQEAAEKAQGQDDSATHVWITDGKSPRKISRITWAMLEKQDTGFKIAPKAPAEAQKKGGNK